MHQTIHPSTLHPAVVAMRARLESAEARIAQLEAENERLRKIAAHIPGRVYIEAKEAAGFGAQIDAKPVEDYFATRVKCASGTCQWTGVRSDRKKVHGHAGIRHYVCPKCGDRRFYEMP